MFNLIERRVILAGVAFLLIGAHGAAWAGAGGVDCHDIGGHAAKCVPTNTEAPAAPVATPTKADPPSASAPKKSTPKPHKPRKTKQSSAGPLSGK